MPQNKRESLIYTVMMCFIMVLWMSIYNVSLHTGGFDQVSIQAAWLGFPIAYVFAMGCDLFFVSKIAKHVAFQYLLKPTSSSLTKMIVISSCMVIPMVLIMSLYGALEACISSGTWNNVLFIWFMNIPTNFIMALPLQLLIAGPFVRLIFRKAFPVGTVLA